MKPIKMKLTQARIVYWLTLLLLGGLAFGSGLSYAEIVIGVVGKTKNDSFYEQSFRGCQRFAGQQADLTCIYDGPKDYQDIRAQAIIVNELIERGIDGLLISTTDSAFLVTEALENAVEKGIPVITFDSDLLPEHHQYRLTYVGTNNFDFGKALGNYVKQFAKEKRNQICIQSGHQTTPNLNERIAGVRYALSGQRERRMTGQQGWTEPDRCPLYSLGKRDTALYQLQTMIKTDNPPIMLAVAGFAQFNPNYIMAVSADRNRIGNEEVIIVSADTESIQLDALKQGLSTANIGQKPFEMGRLSAQLLFNYIKNNKVPEKSHYYLDYHYCTQQNADKCTVNH